MRVIRRLRADVLLTWDPFALYENHQDHRAVAWAAMEAASFSHFPLCHPEHRDDGLAPYYVAEQAGLKLPGLSELDPRDYRLVVAQQIKVWAASAGRRIKVLYAEEFRRVRYGGIERWLGEQAL